ncbi:hypothetical protein ACFPTY_05835 [Halomonas beimenensis]|uniref:hypothetical protein n=1 Tax=Halomonas beimenensis TaxID=475662 RepID=UPI00362253ED
MSAHVTMAVVACSGSPATWQRQGSLLAAGRRAQASSPAASSGALTLRRLAGKAEGATDGDR